MLLEQWNRNRPGEPTHQRPPNAKTMGTAIGDIRWTYLSAVLRYRQVNRPWKHILLKVITDWCYSSADWHLNLCKTAVQLTRLPKGHLFTANTAEQKHLIAFELSISKYGERSNAFSLMVLFFLNPCILVITLPPFWILMFSSSPLPSLSPPSPTRSPLFPPFCE